MAEHFFFINRACRTGGPFGSLFHNYSFIEDFRAAQPLPPAKSIGVGSEPSRNRQNLPLETLVSLRHHPVIMSESANQFSLTRQASITGRAAKKQTPITANR
jgi:hypothetical protein